MRIEENIPFAQLTTFKVGGLVRYVITCESEQDVRDALEFAHERALPWVVLGEGSNVLAHDDSYAGVVLRMRILGVSYDVDGSVVRVTAGAGVEWDALVEEVAQKFLWGIENLAGIPGTVGATPVQNVGAYGAEIAHVFHGAQVLNTHTGEVTQFSHEDCAFGYRDSIFKHHKEYIILSVTYTLTKDGSPRTGYSDLARLVEAGEVLDTPAHIAACVRHVRSQKFPDLTVFGTAGSFFKNPLLTPDAFKKLSDAYGAVPSFSAGEYIKVPLAFILDRILGMRGYAEGKVHLFGNQPLVVVAERGATAQEIDMFAHTIAARVRNTTGIEIEREVQTFPK